MIAERVAHCVDDYAPLHRFGAFKEDPGVDPQPQAAAQHTRTAWPPTQCSTYPRGADKTISKLNGISKSISEGIQPAPASA